MSVLLLSHRRNFSCTLQEYVPLLEHFFDENPFPTHADKEFLAKKSNMQYRQIHVWVSNVLNSISALIDFQPIQFQNRRNRTKKEVKPLTKKPIYEGATKPLDQLYERMKGYMINSVSKALRPSQVDRSTGVGSISSTTQSVFSFFGR